MHNKSLPLVNNNKPHPLVFVLVFITHSAPHMTAHCKNIPCKSLYPHHVFFKWEDICSVAHHQLTHLNNLKLDSN